MNYAVDFPINYVPLPNKDKANDLGYMYFGITDGDPINPLQRVTVYIVRQNDTPLAIGQPVTLSAGGVPLYNGSPVQLEVGGAYSLKVLDKNNQQIYYAPYANKIADTIAAINTAISGLEIGVATYSALASTPAIYGAGQIVNLQCHTSGTVGGGQFLAVSGSVTNDGGTQINSATVGIYWKRINYTFPFVEFFGALGDGTTNDYVAFNACRAAGLIGHLVAGKSYYLGTGMNMQANTGFMCDGGRATIIMSYAGFPDSTNTALSISRCAFIWTSVDHPVLMGVNITLEAGAGLRTAIGFAMRDCTNMEVDAELYGFRESRGGIFTIDSCRDGHVYNLIVRDCTSNDVTLPAGQLQITGLEIDNNRNNGYSKGIVFHKMKFKNLTFGAAAIASRGYQTDGLTLSGGASATSSGLYFGPIECDNVYEPVDVQTSDNYFESITAKNCVYGFKIVHAAKRNFINFIDIDTTFSFGVVISGTNTATEAPTDNIIERVVCKNIGTLGGALQKSAVGFDAGSATYLPMRNTINSLHCDISASQNYLVYAESGSQNFVNGISYTGTPLTEMFSVVSPTRIELTLLNTTDLSTGYVNNRYYGGGFLNTLSTTPLALAANTLYSIPFEVKRLTRFTEIAFVVSTFAAGNARVGIYTSKDGKPDALVYDPGTVGVGTNGTKTVAFPAAQWLQKGIFHLAIVSDVAPQIYSTSPSITSLDAIGVTTIGAADMQMSRAFAYAALPASFGAVTYTAANLPNLCMRAT